jgi:hypothetical protein
MVNLTAAGTSFSEISLANPESAKNIRIIKKTILFTLLIAANHTKLLNILLSISYLFLNKHISSVIFIWLVDVY